MTVVQLIVFIVCSLLYRGFSWAARHPSWIHGTQRAGFACFAREYTVQVFSWLVPHSLAFQASSNCNKVLFASRTHTSSLWVILKFLQYSASSQYTVIVQYSSPKICFSDIILVIGHPTVLLIQGFSFSSASVIFGLYNPCLLVLSIFRSVLACRTARRGPTSHLYRFNRLFLL